MRMSVEKQPEEQATFVANRTPHPPPLIKCTRCGTPLNTQRLHGPWQSLTHAWSEACDKCTRVHQVRAYPAMLRRDAVATGNDLLNAEDATCFYHEDKRAERACSVCGRFVCALCHIEISGRDVCPECIGNTKLRTEHIETTENRRTNYGRLGLTMFAIAFIVPFFALIGFPLAIFFAFRSRGKPRPLASSFAGPMVAGLILTGLQFIGSIVWIFILVAGEGY